MTARQNAILKFIDEYWQRNWTSPSVREIGEAVGLSSPASVQYQLSRLVEMGKLQSRKLGPHRIIYLLAPTAEGIASDYAESAE